MAWFRCGGSEKKEPITITLRFFSGQVTQVQNFTHTIPSILKGYKKAVVTAKTDYHAGAYYLAFYFNGTQITTQGQEFDITDVDDLIAQAAANSGDSLNGGTMTIILS